MKSMKKQLAVLLGLCMTMGMLTGCGSKEAAKETTVAAQTSASEVSQTAEATTEAVEAEVSENTGSGNYGGHINVRTTARPSGLDPLKQTGTWKYQFTTCVFENALTRDDDNNIAPGVCDFELSDDTLTLTMWVRDGVTFNNGDPVTIEDVEASINRSLTLYGSSKNYVAPYVESMTVEDDKLTMKFTEYQEKVLYYIAAYQPWMAVMPKEICEKYADDFIVDQVEDAIGTGPYKYAEFEDSVQITVEKYEDYVPLESDLDGFAGPKYGYADSITFWYCSDDATAANGLLGGQYDMIEVLPAEYTAMAEAQGIGLQTFPSNQSTFLIFNTKSTDGVCAKYPAVRKAVMAAIDYETLLTKLTDNSQTMEFELSVLEQYQTDAFTNADYFGAANQEVVDKYLAEAKTQGYNGEPVQIIASAARNDILTMLGDAMEKSGIPYELISLEAATYASYYKDPANVWDFYFTWLALPATPSLIQNDIVHTNWDNEEKDRILGEMGKILPGTEEYNALFDELCQLMADECPVGVLSRIDWWWWTPSTLHVECDSAMQQYIYNTWWEDPENHPRG